MERVGETFFAMVRVFSWGQLQRLTKSSEDDDDKLGGWRTRRQTSSVSVSLDWCLVWTCGNNVSPQHLYLLFTLTQQVVHMCCFFELRHVVKCKQTPLLSCTSLSERLRDEPHVLSKFSSRWRVTSSSLSLSPGWTPSSAGDELGRWHLGRVTNSASDEHVGRRLRFAVGKGFGRLFCYCCAMF